MAGGILVYENSKDLYWPPPSRYYDPILEMLVDSSKSQSLTEKIKSALPPGLRYLDLQELSDEERSAFVDALQLVTQFLATEECAQARGEEHSEELRRWASELLEMVRKREKYVPSEWWQRMFPPNVGPEDVSPEWNPTDCVDLMSETTSLETERLKVASIATVQDGHVLDFVVARLESMSAERGEERATLLDVVILESQRRMFFDRIWEHEGDEVIVETEDGKRLVFSVGSDFSVSNRHCPGQIGAYVYRMRFRARLIS